MANRTNISAPYYSYEYYLDYLDLMPVDEKKLRANKHSIVIAFWVSLAAFVVFLFLILLYMSWSGSPQTRNATQQPPTCPWSLGLNLPLCIWRQPSTPGPHRARSRNQTPEHPGLSSGYNERAPQSQHPRDHPALLWELALGGDPQGAS
ncbi:melanocortin-2 receptor accessory protein [Bubalus kerabau]|uniref:melanocortin-2 receptor accessory protein n=1 Tax=Bubalus bubalis TaxID=89462 RepID=UPI001E1B69B8|nr:melanocortin-2 receptor accessory protein [Bubalus bubalis]XP_055426036.1 melanocortin-2 receptor accessory protein [Bubalus carabanensis]